MMAPANATKLRIFARIWRVGLALWAMRGAQALDDLAEWIMPDDLKRRR